jgi:hypothetical protein
VLRPMVLFCFHITLCVPFEMFTLLLLPSTGCRWNRLRIMFSKTVACLEYLTIFSSSESWQHGFLKGEKATWKQTRANPQPRIVCCSALHSIIIISANIPSKQTGDSTPYPVAPWPRMCARSQWLAAGMQTLQAWLPVQVAGKCLTWRCPF